MSLRPIVGGIVIALLAACGPDGPDRAATGPRPVTAEEAGVLADVLHRNLDAGGAQFDAVATVGGAPVRLQGIVSWTDHAGSAALSVGSLPPYEVRWTADAVFRALPGLSERMAALGRPGVGWVVRPADPQGTRLDVVIGLVVGLAATTHDNPVSLQQQAEVQWLRSETAGEGAIDVYRKGRLELSIGRADSMLRRVVAQLAFTDGHLRIDLTAFGPQPFALPPQVEIVDGREIPAVYSELTQLAVI